MKQIELNKDVILRIIVGLIICLLFIGCDKKANLKTINKLKDEKLFHLAHHKAMKNLEDLTKTEEGCSTLADVFLAAAKADNFNVLWESCRLNGHSETQGMIWLLSYIFQNSNRQADAVKLLSGNIDKFEKPINPKVRIGDLLVQLKQMPQAAQVYFGTLKGEKVDTQAANVLFIKLAQTGQWDYIINSLPFLEEKKVVNPILFYRLAITAKENKQNKAKKLLKSLADKQVAALTAEQKKALESQLAEVLSKL